MCQARVGGRAARPHSEKLSRAVDHNLHTHALPIDLCAQGGGGARMQCWRSGGTVLVLGACAGAGACAGGVCWSVCWRRVPVRVPEACAGACAGGAWVKSSLSLNEICWPSTEKWSSPFLTSRGHVPARSKLASARVRGPTRCLQQRGQLLRQLRRREPSHI